MADTIVQAIEHIVKTPGVLGGSARIAGRRFAVYDVVMLYYDQNTTVEEFKEHFNLEPAEVFAALAYYHDHREEIDAEIAEVNRIVAELPDTSYLKEKLLRRWQERHGHDPNQEMTVTEVAQEYGISPQAVREACQKSWVAARKSGATWLIARLSAHGRWGEKSTEGHSR